MDVTIIPNKLQGTVTPPSSKSVGHRALIAAALSGRCLPWAYECPSDVFVLDQAYSIGDARLSCIAERSLYPGVGDSDYYICLYRGLKGKECPSPLSGVLHR